MSAIGDGLAPGAGAAIDPLDLLSFLRGGDFRFGTGEALRAVALFQRLAEEGRAPAGSEEAALWLAPILCTSARQQAVLKDRLATFLARSPPPPGDRATADEAPAGQQSLPPPGRRWQRIATILAAAGAVLLVLLVVIQGSGNGRWRPAEAIDFGRTLFDVSALQQAPAMLVSALVPVLWWLYAVRRERERRARIERGAFDGRAATRVEAARGSFRSFDQLSLARAFQGLRTHRMLRSRQIDTRASVRATVAACGQPVLRHGRRPAQPAYPIVVESASSRDHVVDLARALATRLRQEGVDHALFFCSTDPRWLRGEDGAPATLADVAARYREDVLVFVGDGESLRDPANGGLRATLSLDEWATTVLLTPVPRERWSWRERRLTEAGLIVLPATDDGLGALGDFLRTGGRRPTPALDRAPAPPGLLAAGTAGAADFHRDEAPASAAREALLDALAMELTPPAFELLCVLAVYPELRPDLTRYAAGSLRDPQGAPLVDGAALAALAALPWFRTGRMPDWLRLELARELRPARAEEARGLFTDWLSEGGGEGGGEGVEITPDTLGKVAATAARAPGSVLRDALFLRFCDRGDLDQLDLDAPERVIDEVAPGVVRRAARMRRLAFALAPAAALGSLLLSKLVSGTIPLDAELLLLLTTAVPFVPFGWMIATAARGRAAPTLPLTLWATVIASVGAAVLTLTIANVSTDFILSVAGPVLGAALLPFAYTRQPQPQLPGSAAAGRLLPAASFITLLGWIVAIALPLPPALSIGWAVPAASAMLFGMVRSQRGRAAVLLLAGTLLSFGLLALLNYLSLLSSISLYDDLSPRRLAYVAALATLFGGTVAVAVVQRRPLRAMSVFVLVWLVAVDADLAAQQAIGAAIHAELLWPPLLLVPLEWYKPGRLRRPATWALAGGATLVGALTLMLVQQAIGYGSWAAIIAGACSGLLVPVFHGSELGMFRLRGFARPIAAIARVASLGRTPVGLLRRVWSSRLGRLVRYLFSFMGRMRRRQFVAALLGVWVFESIVAVVSVAAVRLSYAFSFITGCIVVTLLIPTFAFAARRLHDMNASAWWIGGIGAVAVAPLLAASVTSLLSAIFTGGLLLLALIPGTKGPNRFGPRPDTLRIVLRQWWGSSARTADRAAPIPRYADRAAPIPRYAEPPAVVVQSEPPSASRR